MELGFSTVIHNHKATHEAQENMLLYGHLAKKENIQRWSKFLKNTDLFYLFLIKE